MEVVTGFPNYPGGRFYPGHEPEALWRREVIDGMRVNRVLLYPSHDTSALRRVANYASFALSASTLGTALSRKADACYVYHPPATVGLPALLWKHARQIPFVYHVQDLWPESVVESGMVGNARTQRAVERTLSWWCSQLYRGASRIAVLSPGFKRILIERGVPEDKIEVVPNWAEEEIFRPEPPNDALAQELGMDGRFNLVFSGNMGHFQGLESAIRAAAKLRHLERFQLVFVGSGQAEPDLKRLAAELGLENVRFLGRHPFAEMGHITALAERAVGQPRGSALLRRDHSQQDAGRAGVRAPTGHGGARRRRRSRDESRRGGGVRARQRRGTRRRVRAPLLASFLRTRRDGCEGEGLLRARALVRPIREAIGVAPGRRCSRATQPRVAAFIRVDWMKRRHDRDAPIAERFGASRRRAPRATRAARGRPWRTPADIAASSGAAAKTSTSGPLRRASTRGCRSPANHSLNGNAKPRFGARARAASRG